MPKASTSTLSMGKSSRRHNPLDVDLTATVSSKARPPKRQTNSQEQEGSFVDSKATRKILQLGQDLIDEERLESGSDLKKALELDYRTEEQYSEDNEEKYDEWGDDEIETEEVEVADIEAFNKFFPQEQDILLSQGWGPKVPEKDLEKSDFGGTNLADVILEKIAAHESSQNENALRPRANIQAIDEDFELPDKIVEVYTRVGLILSRYKSGKLPKPFKILPTTPRWEEILEVTRPDKWTPNACYEATRIFVSSSPSNAQRFMETVILERVRDNIRETKKLNIHLFNCLKKGLYRPAAWFKGFLFPLVGSGNCTLREAHIISAALVRVSIPVLHSAAAIKGLCDIAAQESFTETEGGGATNIFIKALLEKKYALPYQAIDALVFHFLRFRSVDTSAMMLDDTSYEQDNNKESQAKETRLPVIWHQCLLAFSQRYRNDITEDQREALLDLLLSRGHYKIGPEVRRELLMGRGRGEPLDQDKCKIDGDDTLMSDE